MKRNRRTEAASAPDPSAFAAGAYAFTPAPSASAAGASAFAHGATADRTADKTADRPAAPPAAMDVLLERTLAELEAAGSPERARGAAAYFKAYEKLEFFGVDSATVRRMASRLRKEDAAGWNVADAIRFADAMLERPQLEAKGVGVCLLGKFRSEFKPSLLAPARRWLATRCTDWASTDSLCGEVIGPLLVGQPQLVAELRKWRHSRHLYVRRASAVALIQSARRGDALDDAYDAALALGGEDHHLLQKAAGWLLREAGKTNMARLERFLRRHGPRLSRTTVSYAIERFPPSRRKALLASTRAQRPGQRFRDVS